MSRHLSLFKQAPIYHTFILHNIDGPRLWRKVTETTAVLEKDFNPLFVQARDQRLIHPDVLVFVESE